MVLECSPWIEMTEEQKADYQKLVTLRETARAKLKPGVKASEVYEAVKAVASEKGITMEPKITSRNRDRRNKL